MNNTLHAGAKQRYITAAGMADLRQQLAKLKQMRAATIEEMHELTLQSSAGNALEDSCQALQQDRAIELDAQISDIEYIIRTAEVVEQPASNSEVQIGSRVTIEMAGRQYTYTIVGSVEADPTEGKVSNESPIGRSLLGKKVNDCIDAEYFTKNGFATTIIAIQ